MAKKDDGNNGQGDPQRPNLADQIHEELITEEAPSVIDGATAADDAATVDENGTVLVDVLANDTGSTLTLVGAITGTGFGLVTISDNQVNFDLLTAYDYLAVGESADVVITYSYKKGGGNTVTGTLTITITGSNDGSVAKVDTATTDENSTVTVDVLANGTDVDLTDTHTVD